jgi:Tfp pilus assembly protein PilE
MAMLLVGILSGIAVDSYRWAISDAHNSAATQALSAVSLASATYYNLHSSWPAASNMNNVEAAYGYVSASTASSSSEQISVAYDATNNVLDLAAYDASTSTCFFLSVLAPGATAPPLKISSKTLTCAGASIITGHLTSSSGSPW